LFFQLWERQIATTRGKLEAISTSQVSCNYQDTRAMYDNIFLEIINGECQVTRETVPLSHPLSSKTHLISHLLYYQKLLIRLPLKRHLRCWQG